MLFNIIALIAVILLLIFAISKWKIHPFVALLLSAILLGVLIGFSGQQTIEVLLEGFSATIKWIAIVVILGAFIGEVLHKSGGGIRISLKILNLVGQKECLGQWELQDILFLYLFL